MKTTAEALVLDAFWSKAIKKETKDVRTAFEVRESGSIPIKHKEIRCHLLFYIKSDTLQRKARCRWRSHDKAIQRIDLFQSCSSLVKLFR
jgi:hypothetical protein